MATEAGLIAMGAVSVGSRTTSLYGGMERITGTNPIAFGIPATGWIGAWQISYYRGLAKDVHGGPIGQEFRGHSFDAVAFDAADPPQFESEASYLKRHQLLTAGELKRLRPTAYEPVTIQFEPEPDDPAEEAADAKPVANETAQR